MHEALTIARAEIDPEDFRGTTLAVAPVDKPEEIFVVVIEEPMALAKNREPVSIIRRFPRGEHYIVRWSVLLRGGVDKGLHFLGMQEEAEMRYRPDRNLPTGRSMPPNAWMFPH
ncbi:MAG: hypothetical protein AAB414_03360 [Patescibacteria group bacterium]